MTVGLVVGLSTNLVQSKIYSNKNITFAEDIHVPYDLLTHRPIWDYLHWMVAASGCFL